MPFGIIPDRNRERNMVFYGRVSTEHEAQLDAFENQIQWYDDVAKRHSNWTVLDKYLDRGITGTQAKKRPAFLKMLEDARAGMFDLIVTREVCRFARNTVDTLVATRELKNLGIEVYFVDDNIWTMDGDGELRLTLMATLAQEESRKVSERVKAGQKISRDNGVVYGTGNIMGYDRADDTYVINPDQAETVRMIFDMYLHKNMGSKKIANELTRLHRKAASGEVKWTCSNVGRIIANPTYMGYLVYGKSFSNNYLEQKRILNPDKSSQMVVKGDFAPIISEEDWRKAEAIRQSRLSPYLIPSIQTQRKTHTQRQTIDLWAKKLICSCGGHFRKNRWHKNKLKEWSYGYDCYNKLNNGTAKSRRDAGMDDTGYCDMTMIADWKLDMMAKTVFAELWGERKEAVKLACRMIHEHYQNDKPRTINPTDIVMKIARIEERISNLVDMRTDGDISKEEYRARRAKLDAELESAKKELEEKSKPITIPTEEKLRWKEIEHTLNRAIDLSGDKMDEAVADKFIRRVTPLGNNRYAFHMNLDRGLTEALTAKIEGRKTSAVVSFDDSEGDAEASPPIHNFKVVQMPKSGLKSGFSSQILFCIQTADRRLSSGKACNRHAERAARHIR
jgi:DNA invertase Pin-like site-specific DNA recombinase